MGMAGEHEGEGGDQIPLGTGAEVKMGTAEVAQAVANLRAGLPRLREREREER